MKDGKRLLSIDTLRGIDMLFIMGLGSVLRTLSRLFNWPWLAAQTHHVAWEGLMLEDAIFPTFLFLAGVSWPFSLAHQLEKGVTRRETVRRIFVRMLKLVVLGLVYFGILTFEWGEVRYLSVLGRIGIAWGMAALATLFLKPRTVVTVAAVTFVGYWAVSSFVPSLYAPGQDPFLVQNSVVTHFDEWVWPGHLSTNRWGRENFLAIFGAVSTAFCGVFAGWILKREPSAEPQKSLLLLAAGASCLFVGLAMRPVCPLILRAWTPSLVLVVAGIDMLLLAVVHFIVDVRGYSRWTFFFRVIGMNSIFIYMLQKCVGLREVVNFFFGGLSQCFATADLSKLVLDLGYVVCCWLILYFLYRKRIFFKV